MENDKITLEMEMGIEVANRVAFDLTEYIRELESHIRKMESQSNADGFTYVNAIAHDNEIIAECRAMIEKINDWLFNDEEQED